MNWPPTKAWWQDDGAPEKIRTSDLFLRREALYPAELRVHDDRDEGFIA